MKTLAKIQVTISKGKVSEEKKIDERVIADSVADELIQQGKELNVKDYSVNKIHTVIIWKEEKKVKEVKEEKEDKPKKK